MRRFEEFENPAHQDELVEALTSRLHFTDPAHHLLRSSFQRAQLLSVGSEQDNQIIRRHTLTVGVGPIYLLHQQAFREVRIEITLNGFKGSFCRPTESDVVQTHAR
jgi:hypothetical protein